MVYLFAALYCEAHPFIQYFHLKKNADGAPFEEFYGEDMRLVVTGTGSIAAAVAVGGILSRYGVREEDFLLNIGTCACIPSDREEYAEGSCCCACKIIELCTGRTFYPDLIYRQPFPVAGLLTGAKVLDREREAVRAAGAYGEGCLYDMEAAGIYQAAANFLGPHQMQFFKVVSDTGCDGTLTAERIEALMAGNLPQLAAHMESLLQMGQAAATVTADATDFAFRVHSPQQEEEWQERLCVDMHCSATMRASLMQYLRYCSLVGIDAESVAAQMYGSGKLPCRSKKEGKRCLEELKAKLL